MKFYVTELLFFNVIYLLYFYFYQGIGATAATSDEMFRTSQNMFDEVLARLNSKCMRFIIFCKN